MMKGDFGRVTFEATRHMRRVLRQQGRVDVEADTNEQVAILLHYMEAMMADLVGPYAAPVHVAGSAFDHFLIKQSDEESKFTIDPGHYWVDGLLCENDSDEPVSYMDQPDYPDPPWPEDGWSLAYLDVWERHLCADEYPSLREVALGGPDTASRAHLVWQVKLAPLGVAATAKKPPQKSVDEGFADLVDEVQPLNRGRLTVTSKDEGDTDPCVTPPESRYRGLENQLYRVEIHDPGPAGTATFKWSRDNGSTVFPARWLRGTKVKLERLSLDPRFTLKPGDWVEVVDDSVSLRCLAHELVQVDAVDYDELEVTLRGNPPANYEPAAPTHPMLRRWDQHAPDGAVGVEENVELDLEDGIMIEFEPAPEDEPAHMYRTGDYWIFPARVATGDVEWPRDESDQPTSLPPDGVLHHYAPLAAVRITGKEVAPPVSDLRTRINHLTT
jgi:hypothetical protein